MKKSIHKLNKILNKIETLETPHPLDWKQRLYYYN